MTEQVDPVSKAARLIAETIILHDNEWVSFRDIVESRFGGENLDAVVEILSDHLARRVIAEAIWCAQQSMPSLPSYLIRTVFDSQNAKLSDYRCEEHKGKAG